MADGSLLQTFTMLFKSNAKDAIKDMKDLQKASDDTEKGIKKTKNEALETGKAFNGIVESVTAAAAAYLSFTAIKSGIIDAEQFNRTLTIQAKLWGQNANQMAAFAEAAKAHGGTSGEFMSWYGNVMNLAAGKREPLGPIAAMEAVRAQVKGLSDIQALKRFELLGMQGMIGLQSMARESPEDWERTKKNYQELADLMIKLGPVTQAYGKATDDLSFAWRRFWLSASQTILPPLTMLFNALSKLLALAGNNQWVSGGLTLFLGIFGTLAAGSVFTKIVTGFGLLTSAAWTALVPLAAMAAALTVIIASAAAIAGGVQDIVNGTNNSPLGKAGKAIGNYIADTPGMGGDSKNGRLGAGDAVNYLMTKYGWSRDKATAATANMILESGGHLHAVNPDGKHRDLFQWSPERRAGILAGTGIDTATADGYKQLDAMVWEYANNPDLAKSWARFSSAQGAYNSGFEFRHGFENPGGIMENIRGGNETMKLMATTPYASQSGGGNNASLNVGQVTIHTQATDAPGIAKSITGALQREWHNIFAQNADAVAY